MKASGLTRAVELIQGRSAVAQLCVLRDGEVVLDRTVNCDPGSLFWAFSVSKPFVALLAHLLAERGQLSLDEPVATYWPDFGQRGKDAITVRQVLRHRSGVPVARRVLVDGLAMTNWDRAVRQIERAWPTAAVGGPPAYHVISYGFILGELIRRVTGVGVREFLTTEFLKPLELRDTYLGLPRHAWSRPVPVRIPGSRLREAYFNRRGTRSAVIPSAGISTTARDLARFYQVLLDGGHREGVRVLRPATMVVHTSADGGTMPATARHRRRVAALLLLLQPPGPFLALGAGPPSFAVPYEYRRVGAAVEPSDQPLGDGQAQRKGSRHAGRHRVSVGTSAPPLRPTLSFTVALLLPSFRRRH